MAFKVGDRIVIIREEHGWFSFPLYLGDQGEVIGVDDYGRFYVRFDKHPSIPNYCREDHIDFLIKVQKRSGISKFWVKHGI